MSNIRVENLGKAFKSYSSMPRKLADWLLPGTFCGPDMKWILRDICFQVEPGESLGLVGVNGAGKSTLLKIIAGTMQPTCGSIDINGRVAALLELGMGFHMEFTGRQNAAMGAHLYGYTADELRELMPLIEDFAEIGDYMDEPLRTYSSGMQMRLAFSVATAKRPDILIVDEALSVGDSYFQHKSFERIRHYKAQGTTLLIVSHNPAAIQAVCDRALMLEQGVIVRQGKPDEVIDYYNAMLAERTRGLVAMDRLPDGTTRTVSGTKDAAVDSVSLVDETGESTEVLHVGQLITLKVEVSTKKDLEALVLGFLIKDSLGQAIYGINTFRLGRVLRDARAGTKFSFCFEFVANLGTGNYSISLSLSKSDSHLDGNYEWTDRALIFHVINTDKEDFVGCNWLGAKATVKKKSESLEKEEKRGSPIGEKP